MSMELTIPSTQELEALSDAELWDVAEGAGAVAEAAWKLADARLRHWVEVQGKTQTEIAEWVGRSASAVANRCARLGLEPKRDGRGGRPKKQLSPPDNSEPDEEELVEGELVEEQESVSQNACFVDPHEFADWAAVLKAVQKELKDLYTFAEEAPHIDKVEAMEKLAAQLMRRSKKLRKELNKETR